MGSRFANRSAATAVLLGLSPVAAPQLLAFPYSATIRAHRIYSESPIDSRLSKLVADADARAAKSGLAAARSLDQPIFLTGGGWRWTWLALPSRGAFALSRPIIETIVVNRSDVLHDVVENGAAVAGRRSLGGTLTHEMTHGLIRAHFGAAADLKYPLELREGYCDYVAGGGSLTDSQAASLEDRHVNIPALRYWRGRKKVEAALRASHGNVDAMFAHWNMK